MVVFVSARDLPPPYPATVKLIHPLPLLPSHPVCVNLSVKPDNSHSRWWGGRGRFPFCHRSLGTWHRAALVVGVKHWNFLHVTDPFFFFVWSV